jgi:hypothetical protein
MRVQLKNPHEYAGFSDAMMFEVKRIFRAIRGESGVRNGRSRIIFLGRWRGGLRRSRGCHTPKMLAGLPLSFY